MKSYYASFSTFKLKSNVANVFELNRIIVQVCHVQLSDGFFGKKEGGASGINDELAWAELTSFQVRRTTIPRRQRVAGRSVDKETLEPSSFVPHIKLNALTNASTESEPSDVDRVRTERFRQRNVHGHSSDSSVARLLYGQPAVETVHDTDDVEPGLISF